MTWDIDPDNPPAGAAFQFMDEQGRQVWRWRGMLYHIGEVAAAPPPTSEDMQRGVYSPHCGRKAFYGKRKDWRNTKWFAESVREMRQIKQTNFRSVKPGPQRMT